jgi:hypothetical protein
MRVPHSQADKTFHVSLVTARNGCRTPLSEHAAGIPSNPDLKKKSVRQPLPMRLHGPPPFFGQSNIALSQKEIPQQFLDAAS